MHPFVNSGDMEAMEHFIDNVSSFYAFDDILTHCLNQPNGGIAAHARYMVKHPTTNTVLHMEGTNVN